jgi:hypothetical protein
MVAAGTYIRVKFGIEIRRDNIYCNLHEMLLAHKQLENVHSVKHLWGVGLQESCHSFLLEKISHSVLMQTFPKDNILLIKP